MKKITIGVGAAMALVLASNAATVAHWDFETGVIGTPENGMEFATNSAVSSPDGILMLGYNALSGVEYSSSTADASSFSCYSNGAEDGYTTNTTFNQFSPQQWTIECAVKVVSTGGGNHTFIGKDGSSFETALSDFYLMRNFAGNFLLQCQTKANEQISVQSDFVAELNKWYGIACVSDGTNVTMYCNKQDSIGWQNVGSYAFLDSGSVSNALAGGASNWVFLRGWYNNNAADKTQGHLDNVRFSDAALGTNDFVYIPDVVVVPPDAPVVNKLWVNGTTNKLYWTAEPAATNYIVYRSTTNGGPYAAIGETTNTQYSDAGLSVGTSYWYVVSSENALGEGGMSSQLTGTAAGFTIFGDSDSSYGNNVYNYKEAVFDGDTATFYDSPNATAHAGIDLGSGNSLIPSQIAYYPRATLEARMVNGVFQGSNNGSSWDDLYTVTNTPALAWNYAYPDTSTAYRYLRFYTDAGYGNVAEIQFSEQLPPFEDIVVSPAGGSTLIAPTNVTLSATVVEWGASFDSAQLYLNGVLVASNNTAAVDGTNVLSYATGDLAVGSYTGKVVASSTAPVATVTNTWQFTVFQPYNGSTLYNINFQNGGAAVTNGAVIVAPSTGSNLWNNIVSPGNIWTVGEPLAISDVNGDHEIGLNWYGFTRDFGQNTTLSDPLFQGYCGFGSFDGTLDVSGLNPSASYDIVVYFTWGWNDRLVDYALVEGTAAVTNLSMTTVRANCNGGGTYSNIVEGVNYVIFSDVTPSASGSIDINAQSSDGGFSGLQIIQTGSGVPTQDPVIQFIGVSGSTVTLSWIAENVGTYSIERKTSLTAGSWTPVLTGLPSGNYSTNVTASGASQEFYQIKSE